MKPKTRRVLLLAAAIAGMLLFSGGSANAGDVPRVGTTRQASQPGQVNQPGQASQPGQATAAANRTAPAAGSLQTVLPPAAPPLRGQAPQQPSPPRAPQPVSSPAVQPNRPGANPNQEAVQAPKSVGKPPVINVTGEGIDADIKGPLSETLRAMADKRLFDIRGPMPAGEEVSMQFSGLTLDEALKKLMRGYNYVLMEQGNAQKPVLVLLGRIQRGTYNEQASQQARPVGAQASQPSPSTPAQATPPVPVQTRSTRRFGSNNMAVSQGPSAPPGASNAQAATPGAQTTDQPSAGGQATGASPGTSQDGASGGQAQPGAAQPGQQAAQQGQQASQSGQQASQQQQQGQTAQDGKSGSSTKDLMDNSLPKAEPNVGVKF